MEQRADFWFQNQTVASWFVEEVGMQAK